MLGCLGLRSLMPNFLPRGLNTLFSSTNLKVTMSKAKGKGQSKSADEAYLMLPEFWNCSQVTFGGSQN